MVIWGHILSQNERDCYCQWLYQVNNLCHGALRAVTFPGCLKWRQTATKNPLQFIDDMKKIFRKSLSSRIFLVKCTFLPLHFVGNGRTVRKNSVTFQTSAELKSSVLFFFHCRTVHLDIIKVFILTDAQVFKKRYYNLH